MATITYEPTNYDFPNITIEGRYSDGVLTGYRMTANEGYVFYDTTEVNYEPVDPTDPEGEQRQVYYYHTIAIMPLNYPFDRFPYVAVPRDSVDENYIFGGGDDTDHEVM